MKFKENHINLLNFLLFGPV